MKRENGWTKICGHMMYVTDGIVKWGIDKNGESVYPYRKTKAGDWEKNQTMTVASFRNACHKGKIKLD